MQHLSQLTLKGLFSRIAFAFLFIFCSVSLKAQTEIASAKTYLTDNAEKFRLSKTDINDMAVSSAYLSPSTGWYHIYFNQTHQNVEVFNALMNITLKNGLVVNANHTFVENLTARIPATTTINTQAKITPTQAIQKAAQHLNLMSGSISKIQETPSSLLLGVIGKGKYADRLLSNENIDVKLYWLPYESGEENKKATKLALTYSVRIVSIDNNNIWNLHINVNTGEVIRQVDEVIHCDFGVPNKEGISHECKENHAGHAHNKNSDANNSLIAPNQYNVFDYPLESPNHGARTVVSSPYNRFLPTGMGPGTTNGWHNDGTTDYTTTRGNNVFAKEDLAADNETTIGASPTSATLDFNFPYTQATNTAAGNLDAAITNIFYWNNVLHDILWRYGFDEPSGNFQKDNMSKGGAGNDFVFADAQDGSGTNNANFSTPPDGTNGRMQMFIWSNAGSPTYQPDSDFDNGIIAHEYGHGWSIRLTGGPANSSCLQNAEQGGEGWSDYAALMTATDWSTLTPTLASANIPRGIGTYAIGQPITGQGIRPFRYSYDKTTYNNPVTYGGVQNSITFSQPHGIGSIWATMLWDMTWEIILQDGLIGASNIYDVPANIADYRGNVAAMKLVNEGLRLQACSPSFVQARDAIFQADQLLFNGRYRCAIGKAFARRGLGYLASSGTTSNDRAVKEDFTEFPVAPLSSPASVTVCSGQPFTYTATTNQAGTFTYSWTRANATGISTPPVSGTGATISETLVNTTNNTVNVTYVITINQTGAASPGCSPTSFQTIVVAVSPTLIATPYSVCQNATVPSGQGVSVPAAAVLTTINGTITTNSPSYNRPDGDNATTYVPGFNVLYKAHYFVAPSSGSFTFTTTGGSITDTYLALYQNSFNPTSPATNFLRGDDDISTSVFFSSITQTLTAGTTYIIVVSGWAASVTGTFTMTSSPGISIQANQWYAAQTGGTPLFTGRIFNPVGVAGSGIANTSTVGTTTFYVNDLNGNSACRYPVNFTIGSAAGAVTADASSVCSVSNAGTLTLSGHSGTIIRWESSTDDFTTITSIANTTTTLSYTNLTQTTKYRAVVQSGTCDAANSLPATITVTNVSVAGTVTGSANVCSTANTGTLTLVGYTGNITEWQSSTDNFVTNTAVANTTATLTYTNLTQNTQFRAVVQNGTCDASNSVPATISVSVLTAGTVTGSSAECASGNSGTLLLTGYSGNIIRWESSTNNFTTITTIANTSLVQTYNNLTVTTQYRAVIGLTGCAEVNSAPATITVSPVAVGGTVTTSASLSCAGTPVTLTLVGSTGRVFGWQFSNNSFISAGNINNTTTTLISSPTQSLQYRAVLSSGICPLAFSAGVGVLVTPVPVLAAPTVTQPTCTTQGTIVVNATGLGSQIISGTLATTDLTQTGRLNRFSPPSACGVPKANPGLAATTGLRYYDSHTFTNTSTSAVCVTASIQATNGVGMYLAMYSGSFTPANPSTNWLGDAGTSGIQTTFRQIVNAGQTVVLVVSAVNITTTANSAGVPGAYRLSIDGLSPLEYSIDNGTNWQTSKTFSSLAPASYTVTARSAPTNNCPATLSSNPTVLSIQGSSVGGTISADATICSNNVPASGTLTLSGHTGNVVRWESSTDGFVSNIVSISNTATTYSYSDITQTTQFRAIVKDGVCAEVNSAPATITIVVPPVPVVTGGATITLGNSVTLAATGCSGAGFELKWFETVGDVAVTMPVSPTADKQYYAKCEQTLGTVSCLGIKSNDVIVIITNKIFVDITKASASVQDGNTWETAYGNLQTALTAATSGLEIWVAKGTYKPTSTTTRTIYFNIPSGVSVYGGFVGTETSLTERDFKANVSVLSADIGTPELETDNSYHVVVFNGSSNTTVLDGFTVTGGFANFDTKRTFSPSMVATSTATIETGGGIVVQNAGVPTIINCTVVNNAAVMGGGLFAADASMPMIKFCRFIGNQAGFGAAMYFYDGSNGKVNNTLISGNRGIGGVYNNISSPMFENTTFSGNGGYNGGIFNSNSQPVVKNSIIWGNAEPFNDTQSIITYSIVQGGYAGVGNLSTDPKFVSQTPEGVSPNISGDYHLQASSLAIDRGDNGTISLTDKDLDGNLRRFAGGNVDMGAYEFQGSATATVIISVQTGPWEANSTWDIGRVPQLGDNVIINDNHNVTISGTGTAKNVEVRTNAKLIHKSASSKLQTGL